MTITKCIRTNTRQTMIWSSRTAALSSSGRHLFGIRLLILAIVHGGALGTPSIRGNSQPATIVTGGGGSGAASADASVGANVERYYFEHMVGEKDASAAFAGMADELINSKSGVDRVFVRIQLV